MRRTGFGAGALLALLLVAAVGVAPPGDVAAEAPEIMAIAPDVEVQSYALEHQVQDVAINAEDLQGTLEEVEHVAALGVAAAGVSSRAGARYGVYTIDLRDLGLTDRRGAHAMKRPLDPPLHRRSLRG